MISFQLRSFLLPLNLALLSVLRIEGIIHSMLHRGPGSDSSQVCTYIHKPPLASRSTTPCKPIGQAREAAGRAAKLSYADRASKAIPTDLWRGRYSARTGHWRCSLSPCSSVASITPPFLTWVVSTRREQKQLHVRLLVS